MYLPNRTSSKEYYMLYIQEYMMYLPNRTSSEEYYMLYFQEYERSHSVGSGCEWATFPHTVFI